MVNAYQIFMQIERTIRRAQAGRITEEARDTIVTALQDIAMNHGLLGQLDTLLMEAAARDAQLLGLI